MGVAYYSIACRSIHVPCFTLYLIGKAFVVHVMRRTLAGSIKDAHVNLSTSSLHLHVITWKFISCTWTWYNELIVLCLLHTIAMRSLQDASASWQDLKQYKTLKDLQEAVRLDGGHTSPAASSGLRSACWKTFLLFDSVDTVIWPKTLASSRSAYNSLRMHFLSQLDNQDELSDPMDDEADVCELDDLEPLSGHF